MAGMSGCGCNKGHILGRWGIYVCTPLGENFAACLVGADNFGSLCYYFGNLLFLIIL